MQPLDNINDTVGADDGKGFNDVAVKSNDTTSTTVPVGVTIAYKRKNKGFSTPTRNSRTNSHATAAATTTTTHDRVYNQLAAVSARNSNSSNNNSKSSTKSSEMQVFVESLILYLTCLLLPTTLAFFFRLYQEGLWWRTSTSVKTAEENMVDDTWSDYAYKTAASYLCSSVQQQPSTSDSTSSSYASKLSSYIATDWSWCPPPPVSSTSNNNASVVLLSPDTSDLYMVICMTLFLALLRLAIVHFIVYKSSRNSTVSKTNNNDNDNDLVVGDDSIIIDHEKLQTMVRFPSIHLLSSEYNATLLLTPTNRKSMNNSYNSISATPLEEREPSDETNYNKSNNDDKVSTENVQEILLPDLSVVNQNKKSQINNNNNNNNAGNNNSKSYDIGLQLDSFDDSNNHNNNNKRYESDDNSSSYVVISPDQKQHGQQQSKSNKSNSSDEVNKDHELSKEADAFFQELSRKIQKASLVDLNEQVEASDLSSSTTLRAGNLSSRSNLRLRSQRLRNVPRYASAVFCLLYSIAASVLALYYFRNANFWPWYVGGRFSIKNATRNVWNLSGGISVGGMDSDFDQSNALLRKYFLWQASYHLHSNVFHAINMILVYVMYKTKEYKARKNNSKRINDNIRLTNQQKRSKKQSFYSSFIYRRRNGRSSFRAYLRSFVQHALAIVMIGLAYIFSPLRRLGAIGMFAFDFSSCFLHLLQICMNAPIINNNSSINNGDNNSKHEEDKRKKLINVLYKYSVIPTFCYTRFGIWPALWYSIAAESRDWLTQLERMLVPGSALAMRVLINTWMIALMGFTIMYFRRLLHHPHLQRIIVVQATPKEE